MQIGQIPFYSVDIYNPPLPGEEPRQYKIPRRKSKKNPKPPREPNESSNSPTNDQSLPDDSKHSDLPDVKRTPKDTPMLEPIRPKNAGKHLTAILEENPKLVSESPVRLKNYENSVDQPDQYIHQLVNRKNPIIRQQNLNMRRIANIYSGSNAEHVISMHKR